MMERGTYDITTTSRVEAKPKKKHLGPAVLSHNNVPGAAPRGIEGHRRASHRIASHRIASGLEGWRVGGLEGWREVGR